MPALTGSGRLRLGLWLVALAGSAGCDLAYPEVAIVHAAGEQVLLRNPSFNGCVWPTVLADGEATTPKACLPGVDRVHLQKLDAAGTCREQAEDGTIEGICACGSGAGGSGGAAGEASGPSDPGLVDEAPQWFNYQTIAAHDAGYGDFLLVEIRIQDLEQDFSVPGPYGH